MVHRTVGRSDRGARGLAPGGGQPDVGVDIAVGDALVGYPAHWSGVELVVGNPPFATPLRSGAMPPTADAFRAGHRDLLGPYADLAALHLLAAVERLGAGATVAMVQPQSVLAGRDTRALRRHCEQRAPLQALWAAREPVFDAGVRACAVVLRVGSAPVDRVTLAAGVGVDRCPVDGQPGPWSANAALALGAPRLPPALARLPADDAEDAGGGDRGGDPGGGDGSGGGDRGGDPGGGDSSGGGDGGDGRGGGDDGDGPGRRGAGGPPRLGSLATATAGFRDEYYGLVAACREWDGPDGAEPNRLMTVGSVDPLASKWGVEPVRFGGTRWLRPVVDLDALPPRVRTWADRQAVPKVIVATQSKVLEPIVDPTGALIPATPLLAVHAPPDQLALVAAVLLSPPVVAWAWSHWLGTALTVDALKLAARQVLQLPLPADRPAWHRAARRLEAALAAPDPVDDADGDPVAAGRAVGLEVARLMNRAYGADDAVLAWWLERAAHTGRGRRKAEVGPGRRG